jgi:hypothetical protein
VPPEPHAYRFNVCNMYVTSEGPAPSTPDQLCVSKPHVGPVDDDCRCVDEPARTSFTRQGRMEANSRDVDRRREERGQVGSLSRRDDGDRTRTSSAASSRSVSLTQSVFGSNPVGHGARITSTPSRSSSPHGGDDGLTGRRDVVHATRCEWDVVGSGSPCRRRVHRC